ncbi:hypothetical protein Tco_0599539 [Tanacetum coccineum]
MKKWSGEVNESYAYMAKAETLNNNLIKRVLTGSGPPSQPDILMNSYIYEMFNEDKRPNFGLFLKNGSSVFALDLGDSKGNFYGGFWVARKGADSDCLQDGLHWACGQGHAN